MTRPLCAECGLYPRKKSGGLKCDRCYGKRRKALLRIARRRCGCGRRGPHRAWCRANASVMAGGAA